MNRNDKIVDESYLNYIRSLPCLVPLCKKHPADPDHLKARGWREGKRNDYTAIPLCRQHHVERGQIGNVKFCDKHSIGNLWEDAFFILTNYLAKIRDSDGTIDNFSA
jgi:hypothetical protein